MHLKILLFSIGCCCNDKASPKTFDRVGIPLPFHTTMKKVQLTTRQALIANILTQKAKAPAGTTHCSGSTHCSVGL